jgi:hypothetical protein
VICPGCGGVVGRDCWNPSDCEWIMRDMEYRMRYEHEQYDNRCQGCSMIANHDIECIGMCAGLTSDDDIQARRDAFLKIHTIGGEPCPF